MKRYMSDDERAEFEALLRETIGDPNNGGKFIGERAVALRDGLLDAEQAGRKWATMVLDDALIDGLSKLAKGWLKRLSVVLVAFDGTVVGKATRVGRKVKRNDGTEAWQQALIHDMTWAEVAAWIDNLAAQQRALGATRQMGYRILELQEAVPDSLGPADAARRLGTTVEAWIEASAA